MLERHNKKAKGNGLTKAKGGRRSVTPGVGLAAPQIGIQKQVAIISLPKLKFALINPRIIAHSSTKIQYTEGCLSFPGEEAETYRYFWITVESLNFPDLRTFGVKDPESANGNRLLESVVLQHELSHLQGLLFFDFTDEDYPPPSEWGTWVP